MRTGILFTALAVSLGAALFGATAAEAQRRQQVPYDLWCRDQQLGRGGSAMICRAYTYEQCMASRASHTETCYLNPLYDPRFREWRERNPHY